MSHLPHVATALLTTTTLAGLASAQATYTVVPNSASATDITPDGKFVVGSLFSGGAYYWDRLTPGAMPVAIGGMGALAVSDDGSVIIGNIPDPVTGAKVAATWTQATGWQSLGYLPLALTCPSKSSGYDLSGDGATAVGLSWDGCSGRGFKWTQAPGMEELVKLGNGGNRASAISADGSRMAGFAQGSFNRTPAVWKADLSGAVFDMGVVGELRGLNDDGSIALGNWSGDAVYIDVTNFPAVPAVPVVLGAGSLNPGWIGAAVDMAEDLSRIVGFDYQGLGTEAWVWAPADGIQRLQTVVGGSTPPLGHCQAVTPDGRVIVGGTHFGNGWVVELPVPGKATVYGSGVNPAGSMTVLSGTPEIGKSLTLGLDNPLGSQQPGAFPFVVLATAPDLGFPSGTPLPGFGMGPGGVGELLISLSPPNPFLPAFGGNPWAGAGFPAPVSFGFPPSPNLVGETIYAQGVLLDFSPISSAPIGLTDGVELLIGG